MYTCVFIIVNYGTQNDLINNAGFALQYLCDGTSPQLNAPKVESNATYAYIEHDIIRDVVIN